jgi:hypothetical protein
LRKAESLFLDVARVPVSNKTKHIRDLVKNFHPAAPAKALWGIADKGHYSVNALRDVLQTTSAVRRKALALATSN